MRGVIQAGVMLCTLAAASANAAPDLQASGADVVVAEDEVVQDVVLIDGTARIAGVVRGHVYTVDSKVDLESTAIVMKSITLHRGSLQLNRGAVLPPTIDLHAAKLLGTKRAPSVGKPLRVRNGATTIAQYETKLSTASATLMKSVLGFERFVPPKDVGVAELRSWHPKMGMAVVKASENADELVIGGIAKLRFVSDKIRGSFQRGYLGERGTVLVTGAQLVDAKTAAALWDHVQRVVPASKVTLSVKSALRDGAHWFFRNGERYCMLWQRGGWFFAVETRLSGEEASIYQQKQFSEQVLLTLGAQLDALGGTP